MSLVLILLSAVCISARAESVDLRASNTGTLYVTGSGVGGSAEFLLDTGAGISTVSRKELTLLTGQEKPQAVREIAARLANGKLELMKVYEVADFSIGDCRVGSIEVAVARRDGRNLLGLSALKSAAPFAVQFSPPRITLDQCIQSSDLARAF